jgi:hypothetical protein
VSSCLLFSVSLDVGDCFCDFWFLLWRSCFCLCLVANRCLSDRWGTAVANGAGVDENCRDGMV